MDKPAKCAKQWNNTQQYKRNRRITHQRAELSTKRTFMGIWRTTNAKIKSDEVKIARVIICIRKNERKKRKSNMRNQIN